MTVSEAIREWMRGYDPGMQTVTLEQLGADPDASGLFRAPESSETVFVGGSADVTAYYDFFIRLPSQTDGLRKSGLEWVEGLESWVRAQCFARNLPDLGSEKECYWIAVSGHGSMTGQDEAEAIYQIIIEVRYYREG